MQEVFHTVTCILAAGSSKRMGKAKLLLKHRGQTLIEKCLNTVLAIENNDVYVITGAYHDEMKTVLAQYEDIKIIYNPQYQDGMGSSIACAAKTLINKEYHGMLLVLPDQIMVETQNLRELLQLAILHPKSIIFSDYGKTSGPPTFFPQECVLSLRELKGDKGAKYGLFTDYPIKYYDFPFGIIDIDNIEDCKKYDIKD